MNDITTAIVDETFDVRRHLARMRVWQDEWSSILKSPWISSWGNKLGHFVNA